MYLCAELGEPWFSQLNVDSIPMKMKCIWNTKCCFKYLYIHDKITWSMGTYIPFSKIIEFSFSLMNIFSCILLL